MVGKDKTTKQWHLFIFLISRSTGSARSEKLFRHLRQDSRIGEAKKSSPHGLRPREDESSPRQDVRVREAKISPHQGR